MTLRSSRLCALLLAIAAATGCSASVPSQGALLSEKINQGLTRIEQENEKVIAALADVERAILDQRWEQLYASVEQAYLTKHAVAAPALTQDDRRKITATASEARQAILDAINAKQAELVARARANTDAVIELNDAIRRYLLSLEELDATQRQITAQLGALTGFDLGGLRGMAEDKLGALTQPGS